MAALQAFANKKYKLDSSENFDDFMKALGESFAHRIRLIRFRPRARADI